MSDLKYYDNIFKNMKKCMKTEVSFLCHGQENDFPSY